MGSHYPVVSAVGCISVVPAPTSPGLRTICSCRCHRMARAPCRRRRMRRLRHPMHCPRHRMHRPLWSMHRLPQYPLRRPSGRRRLVTLELRTHSKPNCACADVSSIFSATRLRRSLQAPRKSDAVPAPSRLWATSLCSVNANPALDVWPYLLGRMTWGKFLGRMSKQTLLESRLKTLPSSPGCACMPTTLAEIQDQVIEIGSTFWSKHCAPMTQAASTSTAIT